MKHIILIAFTVFGLQQAKAQHTLLFSPVLVNVSGITLFAPASREVISAAEKMPELRNGTWTEYINRNVQYPQVAASNGIERRVVVEFVVSANGKIDAESVRVLNGQGWGFDEEAVRLVASTEWKPAVHKGRRVSVKMVLPVSFRLN